MLRDDGWYVPRECIVERYIPQARIKVDYLNCIDLIVVRRGRILGVQSTSVGCNSEHRQKILGAEGAVRWLEAGGELWLVAWSKVLKKRGGKQRIWRPNITKFEPGMFKEELA
jgi:hypothetical protein